MISLGTTLLCDLRLSFFVPLNKSKKNKVSIHEVAFCFLRCNCKCLFKFSLMTYSAPFCVYDKIRPLESTGIQCICNKVLWLYSVTKHTDNQNGLKTRRMLRED